MTRSLPLLALALVTTLAACDDGGTDDDTKLNGCDVGPRDKDALQAWLEAGNYSEFEAESAVHITSGPHGQEDQDLVRVFVNSCLADSMAAGNTVHPIGSMSVKEMYGTGDTILGYSAMIKVDDQSPDDGNDWYFHTIVGGEEKASELGSAACFDCHVMGTDYVQTVYPFQF